MTTQQFSKEDYKGQPSTLCTGCGHDLLSNQIVNACFGLNLDPLNVLKISGIGCSSKLPAYFMSKSFAFNSMHGRMAPVATAAKIANPNMKVIGLSGDGDTASIGLAGFIHLIRRNVPMVYIVANNGVYGLTKGQFSSTADKSSPAKNGELTLFDNIDLCTLSLELGCGFVARGFVGDAKQMVEILQAALQYPGTAFIDALSPCVTFNNHDTSTKSYTYLKAHEVPLKPSDIFNDPMAATIAIKQAYKKGEVLTGIFYNNTDQKTLLETLKIHDKPLSSLNETELRPSENEFNKMMESYE
ncbi:MAG: thiamine pyrophosphate-dependent enzyme [Pseudobdellovibrio sp.]